MASFVSGRALALVRAWHASGALMLFSARAARDPVSRPGASALGSSRGRAEAEDLSASQPRKTTISAATIVLARARRPERPLTNGAAAISTQENTRPTMAAHASGRWIG